MRTASSLPRAMDMDSDGSGSNSPELEAVTLRPRDIVKLKETVQMFQNVLGGICPVAEKVQYLDQCSWGNLPRGRESPVPGPSGLRSSSTGHGAEWKKGV